MPRDEGALPAGRWRGSTWPAAVVIVAAGLAAYANSYRGVFIFDDLPAFVTPPHMHRLWPPWDALWGPPQSSVAGRPIPSASLALNYALGGEHPWGYHAVNVALHIAAGLLLFGLVRRTLLTARDERWAAGSATGTALAAALIWLVHPLNSEAVTYIVQRTELFVAVFYLLTLYCSLRAWDSPRPGRWITMAIAACGFGMCSKEVMVSAPLAVMLYDWTFRSTSNKTWFRRRRWLYVGLAAGWLILAAIVIAAPRSQSIGFDHGISASDYLRTQAGVIVHYLRLAIWPAPLTITYSDWPIAHTVIELAPQVVLIVLLLAGTLVGLMRRSGAGFLGACFFMILAPTSSFVPIVTEIAAERRMYLPLAAIVVLVVTIAAGMLLRLGRALPGRAAWPTRIGAVSTVLLVTAGGYATIERNRAYHSAVAIWRDTVSKRPNDMHARNNLGVALRRENDLDGAIEQFEEALRIEPAFAPAHFNLGTLAHMNRRYAEAIAHFAAAVQAKPDYAEARFYLADSLFNHGIQLMQQSRLPEAAARFEEVLKLEPDSAGAHNSLGLVLRKMRRYDASRAHLARAIAIKPDLAEAHLNMGALLIETGQSEAGIAEIRAGLRLNPDPAWHCYLAALLTKQGREDEAIEHYEQALRIQPEQPEIRRRLEALQAR